MFARYIGQIKENSTIMLMFGEIDCSVDSGIYPYLQEGHNLNDARIMDTVQDIVSGYVNYCVDLAAKYKHTLIFYGLPVFNLPQEQYSQNIALQSCQKIKDVFNATLKTNVLSRGLQYVDIHRLTMLSKDSGDYLDITHVTPETFRKACSQYTITPT